MSRGERSRPERSAQERQRDREERERRRAGRDRADTAATAAELPSDLPEVLRSGPPLEEPSGPAAPEPAAEAPASPGPPARETAAEAPASPGPPAWERAAEAPAPSEQSIGMPVAGDMGEGLMPPAQQAAEPDRSLASGEESSPPGEHRASYEEDAEPFFEPLTPSSPMPAAADKAAAAPPAHAPQQGVPSRTLSAPPPLPAPPRDRRAPAHRPRRGAGPLSRIAALAALVAVVVAIVVVVNSLSSSPKEKPAPVQAVVKVLIPEGKTRVQIAEIAKAAGLRGSYRVAAKGSSLLNPVHYGAPKGTPDLEGFLFPATYELDRGAQASELVHEQLIAFQENFPSKDFQLAKALHVSAYQLLIVASMIEREAQVPGDRAKIAAVIYNRLAAGMPLGIDATIYYAVEEELGVATYTHELTVSQLHIDSPYNTRTHTGLPPTPIANPGDASITAAAHPAHVAYLYYVAAPDGCGEQVFSDTLAEFEANAAAYEAAVSRSGGHPPSCKHH